jgi:Flp pilus assembly pilin Flp
MKNKIKGVLKTVKKYWKEVDGADLVEYALLLVLVGLAVRASIRTLGTNVSNVFQKTSNQLAFGGTLSSSAVGVSVGNSAAQDNAAALSNESLSAAYAQDAADALQNGNLRAAADLSAAAALIGNEGAIGNFVVGLALDNGAGEAGFEDAQAADGNTAAGKFTAGNTVTADVGNANAATTAAAAYVAAAVAALNGNNGP